MLLLWRLNEKVCMVGGGEAEPIKEGNRVGDRRRRQKTAGRAAATTTGRNSKQKEESVNARAARTHTRPG